MQFNNRFLLKIIELIICVVLIILYSPLYNDTLLYAGSIVAFTIICGVLVLGHFIDSLVEKRLNALFSIVGCVLFIITGALIINHWHDAQSLIGNSKRNALATGTLMIINGVVFAIDTFSVFRT